MSNQTCFCFARKLCYHYIIMMSANSRIRFGFQFVFVRVCALHHRIIIISLCKLIWRHWTYKMPVRYFVECVSKIKHILSVIQYVGLCVFILPISLVMIEIIYIYIYILCPMIIIKSEVWTIIHGLGLGHETMVCTVCLYIFLSWLWYYHYCHYREQSSYCSSFLKRIYYIPWNIHSIQICNILFWFDYSTSID